MIEEIKLGQSYGRSFRIHVDSAISNNADSAELVVNTGLGNGDCGYPFEQGKTYLIDAGRSQSGGLFTAICSLTRSLDDGVALIPQLEAIRNGRPPANLYGYVERTDHDFQSRFHLSRRIGKAPNVTIRLEQGNSVQETIADEGGGFAFRNLSADDYKLTVVGADGFEVEDYGSVEPARFHLPEAACYERNIELVPTGSILGVLRSADGKLRRVNLSIYPTSLQQENPPGLTETSDSDGTFRFRHLSPGDYLLVVNPGGEATALSPYQTFYFPGGGLDQARALHVELGKVVPVVVTLPPPLPTRKVMVRIVWPDGTPSKSAWLDVTQSSGEEKRTAYSRDKGPGLFEAELFAGTSYIAQAWISNSSAYEEGWCGEVGEYTSNEQRIDDAGTEPITLTLRANKCTFAKWNLDTKWPKTKEMRSGPSYHR